MGLRFDALPDAAIERMIRHMHSSPKKENWRQFVSAEAFLSLLKTRGSLSRVAVETFGGLEFSTDCSESAKPIAMELLIKLGGGMRSRSINRSELP